MVAVNGSSCALQQSPPPQQWWLWMGQAVPYNKALCLNNGGCEWVRRCLITKFSTSTMVVANASGSALRQSSPVQPCWLWIGQVVPYNKALCLNNGDCEQLRRCFTTKPSTTTMVAANGSGGALQQSPPPQQWWLRMDQAVPYNKALRHNNGGCEWIRRCLTTKPSATTMVAANGSGGALQQSPPPQQWWLRMDQAVPYNKALRHNNGGCEWIRRCLTTKPSATTMVAANGSGGALQQSPPPQQWWLRMDQAVPYNKALPLVLTS